MANSGYKGLCMFERDLTKISTFTCESISAGDIVISVGSNNKRKTYIVSSKNGSAFSLVSLEEGKAIEVKYAKTNGKWAYDETITTELGGGGIKLYKHSFNITDTDENIYSITIINNSSTPISSLENVGEIIKGTVAVPTNPYPYPEYFISIEYEEETEIGSAYRLISTSILIPADDTTYSTDTVIPL